MDIRRLIHKHTYQRFILRPRLSFVNAPELSPQDIFLASYPRSGNTWVRFIIANILLPGFYQRHSLKDLDKFVPDIYRGIPRFISGPKPRVIKTHQPYAFRHSQITPNLYKRVIYLTRHPYDVARSYFHFQNHIWKNSPFIEPDWPTFVERYIQGSIRFGSWSEHILSWLDRRENIEMVVLRYEDISGLLQESIQQIADFLGRPVDRSQAAELASANSLESMLAAEKRGPLVDHKFPFLRRDKDSRKVSIELTDEMKQRISDRFAPAMRLLDYSSQHE